MEVKSIYMDLVEGKKKGNVWKLESEAFKKPIEIKIGYENKELAEFNQKIEELKSDLKKKDEDIKNLYHNSTNALKYTLHNDDRMKEHEDEMKNLNEKIENQNKEISQLYKVIADAKTMIETQSGTILSLSDRVKELEKKVTKQPMVFQDRTFISGWEQVGLSILEIPSGDYLLISSYDIRNANEYVDNIPYTRYDKITVNDNQYIPMYRLIGGGTELDTPTADIFWTLVFIPC